MGFLELFILLITYSQHQGGSGVLFLLGIQTQSDSWRGCLEVFILVGITTYIQLQGGFWSSFFCLGFRYSLILGGTAWSSLFCLGFPHCLFQGGVWRSLICFGFWKGFPWIIFIIDEVNVLHSASCLRIFSLVYSVNSMYCKHYLGLMTCTLGHILIRGFGPYSLIVGRKISES